MPRYETATPALVDQKSAFQPQLLAGSDLDVSSHASSCPMTSAPSLPGIIRMSLLAHDNTLQTVERTANALVTLRCDSPLNGTIRFGSGISSNIPWHSSSKQPSMASLRSNTAKSAGTGSPQSTKSSRV